MSDGSNPRATSRSPILRPTLAIPLLALFGLAAACGSSASAPLERVDTPGGAGAQPAVPAPTAAPATGAPGGSGAPGALIVRTGTLELEAKDVDGTLPKARDLVGSLGGYVAGSDESNANDRHVATISYRIPVDHWQDALTGLRALADRVVHEQTQAEEVTSQVVDLGARLDNLRASEASLRDIMTRAGTIPDVLAVQDKLSAVRQQIEEITAQQNDLTDRAALGTLTVTWENPVAAVAATQSSWDLGREIDHAAAQTVAAGQAVASALVWFVVVGIPVLGPVFLLIVAIVLLLRRYGPRIQPKGQAGWTPAPPPTPTAPSDGPTAAA